MPSDSLLAGRVKAPRLAPLIMAPAQSRRATNERQLAEKAEDCDPLKKGELDLKMTVSWLLRDRNIRLERNKKKNFFILFTLPYSRVGPIQCRSIIIHVTKLCIVYIKDINK